MTIYINEITLLNFKSFDGKWTIGPLKSNSFIGIIGPNGSGKSNIIDAIAFCMAEKSSNLRDKKLADLVNKLENSRVRNAYVAINFKSENGDENIFKRSIINNSSEYQINGKVMTKQNYEKKLQALFVNVTANNFIIYQDEVSSVIMKTPKERCIMFEKASHSIDFKAEYDYLKNKIDELCDKMMHYQDEKRMLLAYRKRLINAETERGKFVELQKAYEKTMIELTLFNLYVNQLRNTQLKNDLIEMKREMEELDEKIKNAEELLESKKNLLSGLSTTITVVEDKISTAQQQLDDATSDYIDNQEKIKKFEKRQSVEKKLLASAIDADKACERQILQLEEDLKELMEAKERLSQISSQQISENLEKMAEWDQKYSELKTMAVDRAAKFYQKLDSLERKRQPLLDQMENEKRKYDEIQQYIARKNLFNEDIAKRMNKMQTNIQETADKIRIQRRVYTELSENIDLSEEKRQTLEAELKIITNDLLNCDISKEQRDKISNENNILKTLKRSFPGVHGYIYKLLKPIHNRYTIAFTKVFAPYFSNIVCDTTKTAIECIKYLSLYKIGRCTFLPLDENLKVKRLKEHLRSFEQKEGIKNVKLLYDVINFPPDIKRAVLHIVGNTLVCETDDMAMHVAYNLPSGTIHDCVSLNGTYYRKSGMFSGGAVTVEQKSKLLNATELEEAQTKRDEIRRVLDKIHNNFDKSDLKILKVEIEQLENKLKYYNNYLKKTREEFENYEMDIKLLNNNLEEVESIMSGIQEKIDVSNKKIDAVQIEINKVEDEVFADFCVQVNIPNIRKYEKPLSSFREIKLKELEYEVQCERIRDLLTYEKERNTKRDVAKYTAKIEDMNKNIIEQRKMEIDLNKHCDKHTDFLNQCKETLAVTNCEISKLQAEKNKNEEYLKKLLAHRATLDEKLFAEKIMNNYRQRHNLLIEAKMQDVSLPLLEDTLLDMTDAYNIINEFESSQELVDIYEREDKFKFDYIYLTTKPTSARDDIEICRIRDVYKETLEKLESNISSLDITGKISQEFENVKEKLRTLDRQLKITLKLKKDIYVEFEKIKTNRYETFMDCFESTAENVDKIYKEMNGDNSAQALLVAENVEEPYLAGIHYICTPPGKRHGTENLSGSEAAIAVLAMIFAIQSKNPSPFILLDEIDASFDQKNRKIIVEYINNIKQRQQIIAVSLNKELFRNCDTLIGVYPTKGFDSQSDSNLVVLDLSVYQ